MELQFLGSGGFGSLNNYHSNMLLQTDEGNLLIDCGSDIRWSLNEQSYTVHDIDSVYISHIHADHSGGLEWLAFASYFSDYEGKPEIISHQSHENDIWDLLKPSVQHIHNLSASFSTFFKGRFVRENFTWNNIRFDLVPMVHVYNNIIGNKYSYGLSFEGDQYNVLISTDVAMPDFDIASINGEDQKELDFGVTWQYYEKADIIFHDCEIYDKSEVHVAYNTLKELPSEIKEKMWLYHCEDDIGGVDVDMGIVQKGDVFDV